MKSLTAYRNKIATLAGNIAPATQTFDMVSTSVELDDIERVSVKKFPRAYIYSMPLEEMPLEREDITDLYAAEAMVLVDTWRYLKPSDVTQQVLDNTAADVIEAVTSDGYWLTNDVNIEAVGVTYGFGDDSKLIMVQVKFKLRFYFDKTSQ